MQWYHTVSVISITTYVFMKVYIILAINKSIRIIFSFEKENVDNGLIVLQLVYLKLYIF